ncbi:MAG: TlpA family protein disulfide reductase [Flavobacterium sp.]|jgi:peroxiredoxin|nr:TlpA family protein disulfide reductase [Flavobacterium sp.]MBP6100693.1 TlpA family protein disulfide reductase [Flavobacterium sp.]
MKKYIVLALFVVNLAFSQKELPNLSLKDINNENFNLKESFNEKDKLYVFSFWASWCSPCINELDELNDIQAEWKKTVNFEIIAVSTDDSRTQKRVKPLVNGKGWEYKVLLDVNQDFKRALSIVNIPYTIVVKNGLIVHIQNGYVPGIEEELFAKLKSL